MSTLHDIDGTPTLFTKGAIDVLLDRSKWLLTRQGKGGNDPRAERGDRPGSTWSCPWRACGWLGLRLPGAGHHPALTLEDENEFTFIEPHLH